MGRYKINQSNNTLIDLAPPGTSSGGANILQTANTIPASGTASITAFLIQGWLFTGSSTTNLIAQQGTSSQTIDTTTLSNDDTVTVTFSNGTVVEVTMTIVSANILRGTFATPLAFTPSGTGHSIAYTVSGAPTAYVDSPLTINGTDVFYKGSEIGAGGDDISITNGPAVNGQYISGATETDGAITYTRAALPVSSGGITGLSAGVLYDGPVISAVTTSIPLSVVSGGVGTLLEVVSTSDLSSDAPDVRLYRDSSTPVANDELGTIEYDGNRDDGVTYNYARTWAEIKDPDATDTQGAYYIRVGDGAGFGASSVDGSAQVEVIGTGVNLRGNLNGFPSDALSKASLFLGTRGTATTVSQVVDGTTTNVTVTPYTTGDVTMYFWKAIQSDGSAIVAGRGIWSSSATSLTATNSINLIG